MSSTSWSTNDTGQYFSDFSRTLIGSTTTLQNIWTKIMQGKFGGNFTEFENYFNNFCYIPIKHSIINNEGHLVSYSDAIFTDNVDVTHWNDILVSGINNYISNGFYMGYFYYGGNDVFTDFEPYTICQIYLPYFGYVEIPIKDVYKKFITFRLKVDFSTGMASYYIYASTNMITAYNSYFINPDSLVSARIVGEYSFQLGVYIPVNSLGSAERNRNMLFTIGELALSAASSYATGGLPLSTRITSQKPTKISTKHKTLVKGRLRTVYDTTTTEDVGSKETSTYSNMEREIINESFNTSKQILRNMSISPSTSRSQNAVVNLGTPSQIHIIRKKVKINDPDDNYNHLFGKPLGRTERIGDLEGYTEISNIHLEGNGFKLATLEEMNMIEDALSNGFIV